MSEKLDLIRKYAQEEAVPSRSSPRKAKPAAPPVETPPSKGTPAPAGGDVPTKGKPPAAPAIPGRGTFVPSPIRNMQKAIQSFAIQAVAYKKDPRNPGMVSQEDKRKDFNDFLAEQYSAGAKTHGEEWTSAETATKKEQKQPTEIVELDNVINNLSRIGPGRKESMPDGVWDFRTNNAVKNVYAFAEALVKSAQDFGSNLQGFSKFDLKKMYNLIPKGSPEKFNSKVLSKNAEELVPLINKLTEYYKNYSKMILNHPQYVQYINKNTPLFKVQPPGTDPGAIPVDIKQYEGSLDRLSLKNVPVPNAQGKIVSFADFPLSHLKDINSLRALMMYPELGYTREDITNPDKISGVLNTISQYITDVKVAPPQRG